MDVHKCKIFLLTAETKSISKAAEMIGYTQSAVSHTLKSLEKEVGIKLFVRDRYGVHLTPVGADFLVHVRRFLAENERLEQYVYELHGLEVGSITIGTFTSISSSWLPAVIKKFQEVHPTIEIIIKEGGSDELSNWLEHMTIDIAFFSKPPTFDLDYIHLTYDPLVAVLPGDYYIPPSEESFEMQYFNDNPFILLTEGVDYDIRRILESTNTAPRITCTSQYDLTIISMVENHLGISILPKLSFFRIMNDNIKTMPLSPSFYRDLGIGVRHFDSTPPIVRSFIFTVQSFFNEVIGTTEPQE